MSKDRLDDLYAQLVGDRRILNDALNFLDEEEQNNILDEAVYIDMDTVIVTRKAVQQQLGINAYYLDNLVEEWKSLKTSIPEAFTSNSSDGSNNTSNTTQPTKTG